MVVEEYRLELMQSIRLTWFSNAYSKNTISSIFLESISQPKQLSATDTFINFVFEFFINIVDAEVPGVEHIQKSDGLFDWYIEQVIYDVRLDYLKLRPTCQKSEWYSEEIYRLREIPYECCHSRSFAF